MRNNMEPSMLPAYDAPLGGLGLGTMTAPTPSTVEAFQAHMPGVGHKVVPKKM